MAQVFFLCAPLFAEIATRSGKAFAKMQHVATIMRRR